MQYSGHLNINPQPGRAVSQIPTGWFKYVNNVLRFLQVRNGRLIVDNDKWTIECGGGGDSVFSGVVYLGGKRFEDLRQHPEKPYIKINLIANTVTEEQGPPSDPFPPGEEWYEKSKTSGDIHIPRFG